jgi:DNA replication protein DnaC
MTTLEIHSCAICFEAITIPELVVGGRKLNVSVICDDCATKQEMKANADAAANRQKRLSCAFESICPPLYRESDLKRIHGDFSEAVQNWTHSPTGLYLQGKPGTGKTRASWWLLKREHFKGILVYGLTCTEFARFAGEQWHSESKQRALAEEALERCRRVKLLMLDDLGKQKMTERAELELFDLLEHRSQNLLPSIITTNTTNPQLLAMLSEDRGSAILRRIKDFNTIVKIDK